MHRDRVIEKEKTYTNRKIQTSTMGLEMALCSVIVDGFLMKSGAVCCHMQLMVSNHKDTEWVKTKQNKDRKGVENKELGKVLI